MTARLTQNREIMRFIERDVAKLYREEFEADGPPDLDKMRVAQLIVYFEPCKIANKFRVHSSKKMLGRLFLSLICGATANDAGLDPDSPSSSLRKLWLQRKSAEHPTVIIQFFYLSAVHLTTVNITPTTQEDLRAVKPGMRIIPFLGVYVKNAISTGLEEADEIIRADEEDTLQLRKEMSDEDKVVYSSRRHAAKGVEIQSPSA
ncbi:unnamed protein product [Cyclocybe aegerita]|uniref:Uncharacterized protein n=1 Tax=Cyclocybe aegerita TaxID=1973307 RepID=A0A8S0VS79_CYCAE|nr:unnamed protein product [Cyclocybe aegerita]